MPGVSDSNPCSYRQHLASELTRRRTVNPRYSLRAFARHLGLEPGVVSRLLTAKRRLTVRGAERIAERLVMSESDRERFFRSVMEEQRRPKRLGPAPVVMPATSPHRSVSGADFVSHPPLTVPPDCLLIATSLVDEFVAQIRHAVSTKACASQKGCYRLSISFQRDAD